jgi:hypothetical protein
MNPRFSRLATTVLAAGILGLSFGASAPVLAQSSGGSVPSARQSEPYQFPKVAIGKEMSVAEAWKRSQIPDDVLKRLTTEALLNSCLKFPFMLEIYATNNTQKSFRFMLDNFNGLQELFKRPDAAAVILKAYQSRNSADILREASPAERGRFSFELSFLEFFIGQREIASQLSSTELKALAAECVAKYDGKQRIPEGYGGLSLMSTGFVMACLLDLQPRAANIQQRLQATTRSLLETAMATNANDMAELYNQTKLFAEGK